jgi:hypothetical protein
VRSVSESTLAVLRTVDDGRSAQRLRGAGVTTRGSTGGPDGSADGAAETEASTSDDGAADSAGAVACSC